MKREDIEKLLGGYTAGTLTPAEREALFAAALEDQQLFEMLAREEPLRELLQDPAALLYVTMVLARRIDAANQGLLQLKIMLEAGEPRGLIDKTLDGIEGLLSAIGTGYIRANICPPSSPSPPFIHFFRFHISSVEFG